ncbi:MAG: DNA-3-methyladenine glycosylase [Deltaproteobacteria bacterium]|nr:MAG: DNA-3-methyladenine glycosylase [Deltaproteobacteria bacterium]
MRALSRGVYLQPTLRVARTLLGKTLVHDSPEGRTAGRIVEVEAYRGPADRAAHSSGGRRTPRNEVMYGPPGYAYVYFIYGMYFCMNVVCQPAGVPEAVLLRALEPLEGVELMRRRRELPGGREWRLCRGPGALCRALGITRAENGADLVRGPLRIVDAPPVPAARVARTARIGVAYAGPDAARPWRFLLRGSPAVSGPRVA